MSIEPTEQLQGTAPMRLRTLPLTAPLVLAAVALAAVVLAAVSDTASAQSKPKPARSPLVAQFANDPPPLTVKKRSFLDPGPVVPVGSMSNYVTINTIFNRTEDQTFARSLYGNEALPAPLEIPARVQPLVVFEPVPLNTAN
jgi:hypothetical protein